MKKAAPDWDSLFVNRMIQQLGFPAFPPVTNQSGQAKAK